ncbi:hypothetical protein CR513_34174, partial [Mucuna pruriens]
MRPSLKAKLTPVIKQLHTNIPFAEAIATMPKYDKFLTEVISNKIILGEFELVELNEECSTIELKKLPSKLKELRSFTIPYTIMNSHFERGLCDLGPSINLMKANIKADKEVEFKVFDYQKSPSTIASSSFIQEMDPIEALVASMLLRERRKNPIEKDTNKEEEQLLKYLQPQQEPRYWRNEKLEDLGIDRTNGGQAVKSAKRQ